MDVKTLISPSAKTVRVIELEKGNIYKRVTEKYANTYELVYGIVLDVLVGEETFIDVVEVEKTFGEPSFKFQIIGSKSDLNIYPTTKQELSQFFEGIEDTIKKSIENAREALLKKEKSYELFQDVVGDKFVKISNTKFLELEENL